MNILSQSDEAAIDKSLADLAAVGITNIDRSTLVRLITPTQRLKLNLADACKALNEAARPQKSPKRGKRKFSAEYDAKIRERRKAKQ